MPMLTDADHQFLADYGYVHVKGVVPKENCDAVIEMLYDFLGFDRTNPDDWYRPPLSRGGMTEIYQHQALWNNRQHPRVHQLFTEILGTEKLWVTIDRANFNPPVHPDHPEYDHPGMIHWDIDPRETHTAPFRVQGVLYLDHTPVERGGFRCVPGHHKLIERWAATGERIPGAPTEGRHSPGDPSEVEPVQIVGDAGDMVIWSTRLLHGNGRNTSDRPRFAQYISMLPVPDNEALRAERVADWRERRSPRASWAPGDPRHWEELHGTTAELTPLGRKLLGVDLWE